MNALKTRDDMDWMRRQDIKEETAETPAVLTPEDADECYYEEDTSIDEGMVRSSTINRPSVISDIREIHSNRKITRLTSTLVFILRQRRLSISLDRMRVIIYNYVESNERRFVETSCFDGDPSTVRR